MFSSTSSAPPRIARVRGASLVAGILAAIVSQAFFVGDRLLQGGHIGRDPVAPAGLRDALLAARILQLMRIFFSAD
jgi:hypothetical protein